jgi:hypothetical protein
MNAALQRLLDGRAIEPFPATDEEVTARWRVAVGSFHDSRRVVTAEMRIAASYQAALQAAATIVRCGGYRLRATPGGHHYTTFATAAALEAGDLANLANELSRLSRRRHRAVYDWHDPNDGEDDLDPVPLERAVAELMDAAYRALVRTRPALTGVLLTPSGP